MKVNLFLDSGAHSVSKGTAKIHLDDYISFCHKVKDFVEIYANLDVIGDPKATWENQRIMEGAGLKPLPVYHPGEEKKWLKRYAEGYSYFGVGTMGNEKDNFIFFRKVFEYVSQIRQPLPKIHGFGISVFNVIQSFPFFSVDATTWARKPEAAHLFLFIRRMVAGKIVEENPIPICDPDDIDKLSLGDQNYFLETMKKGYSRYYFLLRETPTKNTPKIYFATYANHKKQAQFLTIWGIKNRLVSFAQVRRSEDLRRYVEIGLSPRHDFDEGELDPIEETDITGIILQKMLNIEWEMLNLNPA